jgi:hypothetical protein
VTIVWWPVCLASTLVAGRILGGGCGEFWDCFVSTACPGGLFCSDLGEFGEGLVPGVCSVWACGGHVGAVFQVHRGIGEVRVLESWVASETGSACVGVVLVFWAAGTELVEVLAS